MATINMLDSENVGYEIPYGLERMGIKRNRIDFSKTGVTNTKADVIQALPIGGGQYVMNVWVYVVSGESTNTTATISVGISTDDDLFITSSTIASSGTLLPMNGAAKALQGTYFTANGSIDILVGTAAFTDAIVDVYALVLDLNPTKNLS